MFNDKDEITICRELGTKKKFECPMEIEPMAAQISTVRSNH